MPKFISEILPKTILPRTLLARSFVLIAVLLVISLATSIAIFRHIQQEPRAQQRAQMVVSVINFVRSIAQTATPEQRAALLSELARTEGMHVRASEEGEVLLPLIIEREEVRLMMEKVRNKLGGNTRFAGSRNGEEALWVSFSMNGGDFWISLPKDRRELPPSIWFSRTVLVLSMALIGAFLIALQVANPLKNMVQAAQQVGRGETPQRLSEEGVSEIASVARAFNQMSTDLLQKERERAFVLAGISHDLRTPLTRIRLVAEISGDHTLREGLNQDVDQMDAVIQQFLDFARFDESEAAVPVDVESLVKEVTHQYANIVPALDLNSVPLIVTRPLLLKRALGNLLDNAAKYGGGKIAVQLREGANAVILSVADRGPGIPDAQHEAVKRPFIRLQAARSNASGAGLGLAIVERAARLHGGIFRLENRKEGGLLATLVLPVKS